MSKNLSPNFTESEFACHCCKKSPELGMSPVLIALLEKIRAKFDSPVHIVSGYRCPKHNEAVGSKQTSQHQLGTAADITVARRSPQEVYTAVSKMVKGGGLGSYLTFTHVDVRRQKARW